MATKKYGKVTPKGQAWIEEQVMAREIAVGKMMDGKGMDRMTAMIAYDTELAPIMHQGDVLCRLGFIPKARTPEDADAGVVSERLRWIIEGLAYLHTFLTATNHLTDRELLDRLEQRVLKEDIRFVPPTDDMSEFIDMNPMHDEKSVSDRDRNLPRCARRERGDAALESVAC